jgi:origin recognition complex subunit 1
MQEDIDAREEDEDEDKPEEERPKRNEETVFYASCTVKKPRPKQYRGKSSSGDEAKVYKPGDVILVETDVLYRQKKPPSVAVIVSMWEVKPVGEAVSGDPDQMRLRVHWFLRPSELAAIRQKREHAEVRPIFFMMEHISNTAPERDLLLA